MKTNSTHVRSWPALAIAGAFLGGTCYVLFQDVIEGAAVNSGHVMTALAILATTAAGHYVWPTARRGGVILAAGLFVLALAGLLYIATMSGARNAEVLIAKASAVSKLNGDRKRAQTEYDATAFELAAIGAVHSPQQVRAAMDLVKMPSRVFEQTKQCTDVIPNTVEHRACKPILDLRVEMAGSIRKGELEAQRRTARAALEHIGPAMPENAGFASAAQLLALLPGVVQKPAEIERQLMLVIPWLAVLITELGVVVFSNLAIGGNPGNRGNCRNSTATVAIAAPVSRRIAAPIEKPMQVVTVVRSKIEAERELVMLLAMGKPLPSQDWLADRWGVHKGTVSKWMRGWEDAGLVKREQRGRCKQPIEA